MVTVDEIAKSATRVLNKTSKSEESYEEKVNGFLDKVLEVQANFADISIDLNGLTGKIQEYFNEKESQDDVKAFLEIRPLVMSLISYGNRLYISYRNPRTYSALKTALKNYKGELDSLRESMEWLDRRYSIHLVNPQFELLSKKISEINRKLSSPNK